MKEQETIKVKETKHWHNGGGLYRGVNVPVKLLNYVIVILMILLIVTVVYLGKTSHYTVSYETNGGSLIAETACKYGDTLNVIEPIRPGYDFDGWYLDKDLQKPWNNNIIVEQSGTLYAAWKPKQIPVIFDSNGGTPLNSIIVTFDKPYGKLPIPTKEGYEFAGWVYNNENISMDTVVFMNGEHVLKAQWLSNK